MEITVLNEMIKEVFTEKVTFQQRSEVGEGTSPKGFRQKDAK